MRKQLYGHVLQTQYYICLRERGGAALFVQLLHPLYIVTGPRVCRAGGTVQRATQTTRFAFAAHQSNAFGRQPYRTPALLLRTLLWTTLSGEAAQ